MSALVSPQLPVTRLSSLECCREVRTLSFDFRNEMSTLSTTPWADNTLALTACFSTLRVPQWQQLKYISLSGATQCSVPKAGVSPRQKPPMLPFHHYFQGLGPETVLREGHSRKNSTNLLTKLIWCTIDYGNLLKNSRFQGTYTLRL